jgi:hypothetical protein
MKSSTVPEMRFPCNFLHSEICARQCSEECQTQQRWLGDGLEPAVTGSVRRDAWCTTHSVRGYWLDDDGFRQLCITVYGSGSYSNDVHGEYQVWRTGNHRCVRQRCIVEFIPCGARIWCVFARLGWTWNINELEGRGFQDRWRREKAIREYIKKIRPRQKTPERFRLTGQAFNVKLYYRKHGW